MTNELIKKELTFDVSVDTKIVMSNEEALGELVASLKKKYSNLIFTDENTDEAKTAKKELRGIIEQIEGERKRVKKVFNEPLKAFELAMKKHVKEIEDVIEPIDKGISAFEEEQKQGRLALVKEFIEEAAPNYNVSASEITINESWLLKSLSGKKRNQLISDELTRVQREKQELVNAIAVITGYCEALKIDKDGWLLQVEQGVSSSEVMRLIDESVKRENDRIEQDQKKAAEIAEAEKKERVAKEESKDVPSDQEKDVKESIGRGIPLTAAPGESFDTRVSNSDEETITLRVTGTSQQIDELSAFTVDLGVVVEIL